MRLRNDLNNKSFLFISQSGCLLPMLILFNFFFGWMFFLPAIWLGLEAALVLLFIINSYIFSKRVSGFFTDKKSNVIDVEGKVMEEREKIK